MSRELADQLMESLQNHNDQSDMDWLHRYGIIEVERDHLRMQIIIRNTFNLNGIRYRSEARIPFGLLEEDDPHQLDYHLTTLIERGILEAIREGPPVDQNNPSRINRRIFEEAWESIPSRYQEPPSMDQVREMASRSARKRLQELSEPEEKTLPAVKVRTFRLD